MNRAFKRFAREYYPEFKSWFTDPELNHHFGPLDADWLDAVLSKTSSQGATWGVFRGVELVAVVEMVFDPGRALPAGITA